MCNQHPLFCFILPQKTTSGVSHRRSLYCLLLCLLVSPTAIAGTENISPEPAEETSTAREEAQTREMTAEEDPLAEREAHKEERESRWYKEPNKLRIYGSGRLRYRDTGLGGVWGDGGSRVGIESHWQMLPKRWLFGGAELGFSLLDQLDQLFDPGSASGNRNDDVFTRLAYIGFEGPHVLAVFGKNWSPYYKVASFTDRFAGTGGSAGGVYNAHTDGGDTGTGRANRVLQTRLYMSSFPERWKIKPFNLNLQLQSGQPVPAVDNAYYGTAVSASAILDMENNFSLGIAYNDADIPDPNAPVFNNTGIDGDARALLIGSRWYGQDWYLGVIVSRLENHETTEKLVYFDGTGSELYAQYRVHGPWWVTAGYNKLTPDSDQLQAGEYNINYSVFGLRYSNDDFRRMFYFNIRLSRGKTSDGGEVDNVYTFGIRWDLDRRILWEPLISR